MITLLLAALYGGTCIYRKFVSILEEPYRSQVFRWRAVGLLIGAPVLILLELGGGVLLGKYGMAAAIATALAGWWLLESSVDRRLAEQGVSLPKGLSSNKHY